MNILGLIFHEDFGHPSACLLQDGKLTAFVEEERLIRVKQAKSYFPSKSIAYCLNKGKIGLQDVDLLAFGWDAKNYRFKYPLFLVQSFLKYRIFHKKLKKNHSPRPKMGAAVFSGFKDILNYHPQNLKQQIILGLNEAGFNKEEIPPLVFVKHHHAHAASAFYCSGFDEAAILAADGHGEENTITIFKGEGKNIKLLKEINIPHSLGWFYSAFTEYLGWDPNEGEVKLMGLAPFGQPNPEIKTVIDDMVTIIPKGVKLNPNYLFYHNRSYGRFYSDAVVDRLGLPRGKNEEITQRHKDIAFAVQEKLEEAGISLARKALQLAGSQNLCLVGGVALNCKMNGEIHKSGIAKNIFVQPISYDAGVSLGAAMMASMQRDEDCRFPMAHVYLGPSYSDEEIKKVLIRNKVTFEERKNIAQYGAQLLIQGKIVGWFQGQLEAGPRALGDRSILADPRDPQMKDKVNDSVKFRENWRPFALSILEEDISDYLKKPVRAPFMIMAFDVMEDKTKDIQSAMHWIDHTTRPQTVNRQTNPLYWELIHEFKKLTGVPGILNTSFNVRGEPIVCSPVDALRCFFGTGMDALIMGSYVITK